MLMCYLIILLYLATQYTLMFQMLVGLKRLTFSGGIPSEKKYDKHFK